MASSIVPVTPKSASTSLIVCICCWYFSPCLSSTACSTVSIVVSNNGATLIEGVSPATLSVTVILESEASSESISEILSCCTDVKEASSILFTSCCNPSLSLSRLAACTFCSPVNLVASSFTSITVVSKSFA